MVDQVFAVTLGQEVLDKVRLWRRQLWAIWKDPLVGHQALEQKFEGAAKKNPHLLQPVLQSLLLLKI